MRDCQLAERGTHQQLMQRQGGYYELVSCDAASQQKQQQQPQQKAADTTAAADGMTGIVKSLTFLYKLSLLTSLKPQFILRNALTGSSLSGHLCTAHVCIFTHIPCETLSQILTYDVLVPETGAPGGRFTTDEKYASTAGILKNFGVFYKVTYSSVLALITSYS